MRLSKVPWQNFFPTKLTKWDPRGGAGGREGQRQVQEEDQQRGAECAWGTRGSKMRFSSPYPWVPAQQPRIRCRIWSCF